MRAKCRPRGLMRNREPSLGHRKAQVIGDRLVHVEARKPAKGGGEVDAFAAVGEAARGGGDRSRGGHDALVGQRCWVAQFG